MNMYDMKRLYYIISTTILQIPRGQPLIKN